MYARVTTVLGDAARIDRGIAFVKETVQPLIEELPGSLGLIMLVDRTTGRVVVGTAWETEQARAASDKELAPIRDEAGRILSGEARPEELEYVVAERAKAQQPGYWVRHTRLTAPTDRIDESIDEFKTRVLPAIRGMQGFCSAVLMIDRGRGKAVAATCWDSREALEASRGPVVALREGTAQRSGATIDAVVENEIVIAGLHDELWSTAVPPQADRRIELPTEQKA